MCIRDRDIVDLGVIVGDTQRNFASCQLIQQDMAVFLPRMDKFDFRRNVLCAAQCIGGEGFFKIEMCIRDRVCTTPWAA